LMPARAGDCDDPMAGSSEMRSAAAPILRASANLPGSA